MPYALSQIPQGINYQAIARDGAGAILDNKTFNIELTVQTSTAIEIWKELKNVTSNQFGLVTTVLGTGTNLVGGGVASFSMIDWNAQPLYLKTRVQYPGTTWNVMGTSQLWSVPYSLVAKDLEGPVAKLGIAGTTEDEEESLFEVKNKQGEIVFAVYNEGVRVYVPEGAKGTKGGFAVSGWGYNKAVPENYLFVGPDSIRAYIWDDPLVKGVKGGFTVSGFNSAKKITNNYLTVTPDSVAVLVDDVPNTKGAKGGFTVSGFNTAKAGELQNLLRVNDEFVNVYIDDTGLKGPKGGFTVSGFANAKAGTDPYKYLNVTHDSTRVFVSNQAVTGSLGGFAVKPVESLGQKTEFFNISSSANAEIIKNEKRVMWYPTKAALIGGEVHVGSADSVGLNSTALGYRSIAKGNQSQAFGYRSIAYGLYSTAIGYEAKANNNAMAVGYKAEASGSDAFALGSGAIALANKSFAFGSQGIDSANNVTGKTKATGEYAYAFGLGSIASGKGAFALGANDTASGNFSFSIGYKTKSGGWYSTSMGGYSSATNSYSTAMGFRTKSTAIASFSSGYYSEAKGDQSVSIGFKTKANGSSSVALGSATTAQAPYSFAINNNTIASGNGSSAFGGSTVASGQYSMATGQNTTSGGWYSLAGGDGSSTSGEASFSFGKSNTAAGKYSFSTGIGNSAKSYQCFTIGSYCSDPGTNATGFSSSDPLFIAGNGYLPLYPSRNALILYKNGNMTIAGTLTQSSDIRLKNIISPLPAVLEKILSLKPMIFEFKDQYAQPSGMQIGFSAQEVQGLFPELVTTDASGYLALDYTKISVLLVKALEEQNELLRKERERNDKLEKSIIDLSRRLDLLEDK